MTRINVVPPKDLCDQHLLAEHRELTRIPNAINAGRFSLKGQPDFYTLGQGHVKFFYNKLEWLSRHYLDLLNECSFRGFNVKNIFPKVSKEFFGDYEPTQEAIKINKERIIERLRTMKQSPRWTKREPPAWVKL